MKKYSVLLMVIVLVFSFVSLSVVAQPSGNGNGGSSRGGGNGDGSGSQESPRGNVLGMNGLMGLNLSEQQRKQIRLMMQEHQAEVDAERVMNQVRVQEMRQLQLGVMNDDDYDEAAAYDILAEQGEMKIERQLIRQRLQHRILHEVLTEDQMNQLQNQWQNQAAFSDGVGQGPGPGEGLGECPYM